MKGRKRGIFSSLCSNVVFAESWACSLQELVINKDLKGENAAGCKPTLEPLPHWCRHACTRQAQQLSLWVGCFGFFWFFFLSPWHNLLILPAAMSLQQGHGDQPGLTNPSLLKVQLVRPRTGSGHILVPELLRKHKGLKTSELLPWSFPALRLIR